MPFIWFLSKWSGHREQRKEMRWKPYIRYERKHRLSAVHIDWHTGKINGKEVCVVLDGSSRFILAGGEFNAALVKQHRLS